MNIAAGRINNRNLEAGGVYCVIAQLFCLLPFKLAQYVPWSGRRTLQFEFASFVLLLFPLCFALVNVLILYVARAHGRPVRAIAVMILFAANCIAVGAVQYHLRFGVYPSMTLVRIALQSPQAFLGYMRHGVYFSEIAAVVVTAAVTLGCIVRAQQLISTASIGPRVPIYYLVVIALAFPTVVTSLYEQPSQRMIVQHTLPWLKWTADWLDLAAGRSITQAEGYLPPNQERQQESPLSERAQHVVIVIADSLRPDHLPWNGYSINTMPLLNRNSAAWVRFRQGRANAPSTEESFPILFNNRYLAGVRRDSQGSGDLWMGLRAEGIHTGFFSSAPMEWGGLTNLLNLSEVGSLFTASLAEEESKRHFTSLAYDYAVADDEAVRHWEKFFGEASKRGERTLSVVHLMGSHYPFLSAAPGYQRNSLPGTTQNSGVPNRSVTSYEVKALASSDELLQLEEDYDRALGSIDSSVTEIFRRIDELGELQRSVVIFTADHGESLGERGYLFHGTNLFDEQLRVPLDFSVGRDLATIRSKLEAVAGSETVSLIDVVPTALEVLALPIPQGFQGYSLIRGDRKPYDVAVASSLTRIFAIWGPAGEHVYDLTTDEYWSMNLRGESLSAVSLDYGRFENFLAAMASKGIVRPRKPFTGTFSARS